MRVQPIITVRIYTARTRVQRCRYQMGNTSCSPHCSVKLMTVYMVWTANRVYRCHRDVRSKLSFFLMFHNLTKDNLRMDDTCSFVRFSVIRFWFLFRVILDITRNSMRIESARVFRVIIMVVYTRIT